MTKELKEISVDTYIWTVNDYVSMHKALDLKVDGIITNYPEILVEIMMKKQL